MFSPIQIIDLVNRWLLRRSAVVIALAMESLLQSPIVQAANPPSDGGYANGNSAQRWVTASLVGAEPNNARLLTANMDGSGNEMAAWTEAESIYANLFSDEPGTVTFTDVSVPAGFFGSNSSWAAAWGDYDNDGNPDVMTLGHVQGLTNSISQLWHNNGDGTFTDVTIQTGLNPHNGDAHGAVWSDLDGDGYVDLYISKGTQKADPNNYNELWKNNGDDTFTNVAASSRVWGRSHRNRGAYAVDYDLDSDLDIFAASFDTPNLLYRNEGGLQFTDVAEEAGLQRSDIENRTAAWADFDGDGFIDVLITKSCVLFKNRGDGTFVDVTAAAHIAALEDAESGAWGDYDNDGNVDLYITTDGRPNSGILYRNNGDGTFTDVTTASGAINEAGALGVTWGDYDNDGYLDLYIVNTEKGTGRPNRLFRNNGDGTFTDLALAAGVGAKPGQGRGSDATFVDYNNDGFLDLFVCNGAGNTVGPYLLYRNNGNTNHWLKVVLRGQQSNRDGIGAKIRLTSGGLTQFREYTGQHYMAQNLIPIHFGLGQATVIDSLTVHWPSGITQTLRNIAVDQNITVTEPARPK